MIKTDSSYCDRKRNQFNFASLDTIGTFVSMTVSPLYNDEIVILQRKETNSTYFANMFSLFRTTFLHFCISKANCSFLEKIFSKIVTNSESACLLLQGDSRISQPDLNLFLAE